LQPHEVIPLAQSCQARFAIEQVVFSIGDDLALDGVAGKLLRDQSAHAQKDHQKHLRTQCLTSWYTQADPLCQRTASLEESEQGPTDGSTPVGSAEFIYVILQY
jgi:hypothetical protein